MFSSLSRPDLLFPHLCPHLWCSSMGWGSAEQYSLWKTRLTHSPTSKKTYTAFHWVQLEYSKLEGLVLDHTQIKRKKRHWNEQQQPWDKSCRAGSIFSRCEVSIPMQTKPWATSKQSGWTHAQLCRVTVLVRLGHYCGRLDLTPNCIIWALLRDLIKVPISDPFFQVFFSIHDSSGEALYHWLPKKQHILFSASQKYSWF